MLNDIIFFPIAHVSLKHLLLYLNTENFTLQTKCSDFLFMVLVLKKTTKAYW